MVLGCRVWILGSRSRFYGLQDNGNCSVRFEARDGKRVLER